MRALVVTLTLAMIVAFSVAALVLFAGVRVNQTMLVSLGLGLFLFAGLFAAISALGPKYGPTPALTPIMAGMMATAFASLVVIVAHLQLSPAQGTTMNAGEPAVVVPAPIPSARTVDPTPPSIPVITATPPGDFASPPAVGEAPAFEPPPTPGPEPMTAAIPQPDPPSAGTVPLPPIPPTAPAEPALTEPLIFSADPFDTGNTPVVPGEIAPSDAPRMATPPLPRSRPCGADGPPCP